MVPFFPEFLSSMRIYLHADLEGVAGVLDLEHWCHEHSRFREQAGELLTLEVNAAVEGFLAAGADSILVADGHGGGGRGLVPGLLHPAAELSCYAAFPMLLREGGFDVAGCVGQYPKAGTVGGHLCHTTSHGVRDRRINGRSVGDFGEMTLGAAECGVRWIFASGCEALAREAQALVPGIETVAVKRGLQTDPGDDLPFDAYQNHNVAAIHCSPETARARICAGARRALERARREPFGLVRLDPPYVRVTDWRATATRGPYRLRQAHPASILALLNVRGTVEPLDADPAAAARLGTQAEAGRSGTQELREAGGRSRTTEFQER